MGESATLFRFLKFLSWKSNLRKSFKTLGTLTNRIICDDPKIIDWSIKDLLTLDGGTSQWASIAYICGNRDLSGIKVLPNKLSLTVRVCDMFEKLSNDWEIEMDDTIERQYNCFKQMLDGKEFVWTPIHSEDYCFARAFGVITKEVGLNTWPSLVNHESNRIDEMERCILELRHTGKIDSKDHRVVQSLSMYSIVNKIHFNVYHRDVVNKSWPEFWDMIISLNRQDFDIYSLWNTT